MKTFTLFASLVVEAFVLSASPRLPFSSQEPCASFLSAAGPAQASRRNLRRKTSHLPHWSCPVRKKLFSFDMKCKDSRHEKGMMPRKINRLIKRRKHDSVLIREIDSAQGFRNQMAFLASSAASTYRKKTFPNIYHDPVRPKARLCRTAATAC